MNGVFSTDDFVDAVVNSIPKYDKRILSRLKFSDSIAIIASYNPIPDYGPRTMGPFPYPPLFDVPKMFKTRSGIPLKQDFFRGVNAAVLEAWMP